MGEQDPQLLTAADVVVDVKALRTALDDDTLARIIRYPYDSDFKERKQSDINSECAAITLEGMREIARLKATMA